MIKKYKNILQEYSSKALLIQARSKIIYTNEY